MTGDGRSFYNSLQLQSTYRGKRGTTFDLYYTLAKNMTYAAADMSEGPRRFSELERSCPGISPRTLSERLRVLEQEGILQRTSARRRVDYSLTEKGEALLPIIDAMRQFGHEWLVPEHGHAHTSADDTALV